MHFSRSIVAPFCMAVALLAFNGPTLTPGLAQSDSEFPREQQNRQSGEKPTDEELRQRVETLMEKLHSIRIPERDEAEQELVALGYRALDYVEISPDASTDARERVQRVRAQLEKMAIEAATQPSRMTLDGTYPLNDVLKKIREETGNQVELPEGFEETLGQTEVTLSLKDATFWSAIDAVCRKAGVKVDPFGSRPGILTLSPQAAAPDQPPVPFLPASTSSVFQVAATRVDASRNLVQPMLSFCRIQLRIRWEPRIQPVSLELPLNSVKIIDEFDQPVQVEEGPQVLSAILQPGIPEVDFLIPLPRIDRQIEELKSLTGEMKAVVPGQVETFHFRDVSQLKPGTEIRKSGAVLTYLGTTQNENLYAVQLKLAFDETNGAFESYQGWVFENPTWLLDEKGNRTEPVGMETLSQSETEVAIQYFFLENPLERTIAYQTPTNIIALPVKLELSRIPLP